VTIFPEEKVSDYLTYTDEKSIFVGMWQDEIKEL
jgi:hypothetical protein